MPTYRDAIRVEPVGLDQTVKKLEKLPDALKQAIQNTIKKGVAFAKEEIPNLITERYAISRSSLLDQTRRAKVTMRAKYSRAGGYILNGAVVIKGTRLPVMRFSVDPKYVPNQKGIPVSARQIVTVRVKRGTAQVGKPNVFIAKMKSGHIGVFRRKPDATHRMRPDGQRTQLNITEEYMISVPEMLQGKELRTKTVRSVARFMRLTFMQETKGQGMRFRG